jgi:hypothetical protein
MNSSKNETPLLTLYFIPSPYGINWQSPTTVARTIVLNKFGGSGSRFMGHVNIELDYTNDEGKKIHILTGMAAENLDAIPLLLKEKIGLGIMFHSFKGKVETKEELVPELDGYFKKGNKAINFVQFKINQSVAKRVEQYFAEYTHHNVGQYYGLVNSPLHGEGSGCSAFGASFLDVAGLLEEEFKEHWTHCIKVPHKIAGKITDNKANFFKIMIGGHDWASDHEDHHEIFFWDPDKMHRWVEEKVKQHNSTLSTYGLTKIQNATGLVFDVTHKEAPTGPIFKRTCDEGKPVASAPDLNERSNVYKYR